jgi:putative methyltransferase
VPGYPDALDPSRWLFVNCALNHEALFSALKRHLASRYPEATRLSSLVDYQREVIILPAYDRRTGKRFQTDWDWLGYFREAHGRVGAEGMAEPAATPGAVIEATDQTCGERGYLLRPLNWEDKAGQDRVMEWIRQTVLRRNSARKQNFQQLSLLSAGDAVARTGAVIGSH